MKIIISPAKKMLSATDDFAIRGMPVFLKETQQLLAWMQTLSYQQLKNVWQCSDRLAKINCQILKEISLTQALTPAIMAYNGIQFQAMGSEVFSQTALDQVAADLYILSGFYGVLHAFDGVQPYRLEMRAKINVNGYQNLYQYWGDRLYRQVFQTREPVIDLASKEYSQAIEKYLQPGDCLVTCSFKQFSQGKYRQLATAVKRARGNMVRFIVENQLKQVGELKDFNLEGYRYQPKLSSKSNLVFVKESKRK
ncbi:peroxide stress protein YaaA [Liquorilactobacillus sicerae]|uniref:peroxide stress protein YaaA n=1 Tax=Liquorilactobacillus sicerae TaxID=1416943 RepID=UPI0024812842|nr:peroxide stress protein YaaA [Liquorilactobacillus sicerae]